MSAGLASALGGLTDHELAVVVRALPDHVLAGAFRGSLPLATGTEAWVAEAASDPPVPEPRTPLAVEPHEPPTFAVKEPDDEVPGMPPGLPRSYRRVFRFLAEHDGPYSSEAIAARLGMPKQSARIALRNLKQRGLVDLTGRTSGALWCLKRAAIPAPESAPARTSEPPSASPPAQPSGSGRVVSLPVLSLRVASDMFRCEPLSVTMMARACVARQQGARAQQGKHATCRACPLGERVGKAVGLNPSGTDLIDDRPGAGSSWARARKTGT